MRNLKFEIFPTLPIDGPYISIKTIDLIYSLFTDKIVVCKDF